VESGFEFFFALMRATTTTTPNHLPNDFRQTPACIKAHPSINYMHYDCKMSHHQSHHHPLHHGNRRVKGTAASSSSVSTKKCSSNPPSFICPLVRSDVHFRCSIVFINCREAQLTRTHTHTHFPLSRLVR
jgi:hypothetical protein